MALGDFPLWLVVVTAALKPLVSSLNWNVSTLPVRVNIRTRRLPIGQKPETDPHRKIGSRSIGAVGKLSLSNQLSLSLWLSVTNSFFF